MPFNGSAPFSPQPQATPAALGARREDLEILGTDDGARSIAALIGSAPQLDERVPQRDPVGLRKRRERAIGGAVVFAKEIDDSLWRERVVESVLDASEPQIRNRVPEALPHCEFSLCVGAHAARPDVIAVRAEIHL